MIRPIEDESTAAETRLKTPHSDRSYSIRTYWLAWLVTWFGIVLAGGVFGMFLAAIPGFVIGAMVAGIYGAPIALTIALLTWALWLTRYQIVAGTVAGVLSGVLSTLFLMLDSASTEEMIGLPLIAGCLGGLGSWLTTFFYQKKRGRFFQPTDSTTASWQFSLKDMFVRFTMVSMLAAAWSLAVSYFVRGR